MTDMEIKNKVAVVTGGARGIGLAIVEDFLKEEAKAVVIVDLNNEAGKKVSEELNSKYGHDKVLFIKGDVTQDLDKIFEDVIAKYNTIDILVNNAGVLDENDLKKTININLVATVEWSMKFLEYMRKDKGGKGGTILNIASIYGFVVDPFLVYYKASKFAVMGFTQTMGHRMNYNVTGVRVVALCPGFSTTELAVNARPNDVLEFQVEALKKMMGECDWQTVADVARAALDVIKTAESGTAWAVVNGEQIKNVPAVDFTL